MTTFEKALANEKNTAHVRLFLHICKAFLGPKQGNLCVDDDVGITFHGLTNLFNHGLTYATVEEVSDLFDKLVKKYGSMEKVELYVDWFPMDDFQEVLKEWETLINKKRDANSIDKLKMQCLGTKTRFCSKNGCVVVNGMRPKTVLDHHGDPLPKNPWNVAYESEKESDILIAKELQPVPTYEMQAKLTHRSIVRGGNYSIDNIPMFVKMQNYGIAKFLLDSSTVGDFDVTYVKAIKLSVNLEQWDIVTIAIAKIRDEKKLIEVIKRHFRDIVRHFSSNHTCNLLQAIIDNIQSREEESISRIDEQLSTYEFKREMVRIVACMLTADYNVHEIACCPSAVEVVVKSVAAIISMKVKKFARKITWEVAEEKWKYGNSFTIDYLNDMMK